MPIILKNHMIVTIQSVPERSEWVANEICPRFSESTLHVFCDENHRGCEYSFKQMLDYEVADYRLHVQDDVVLHPNIEELARDICGWMSQRGIHVCSLFVPFAFKLPDDVQAGALLPYKNYSWLQATLFSRNFVQVMKHESTRISGMQDDKFVQAVAKKYKCIPQVHYPSLCQHRIDQVSIQQGMKQTKQRATKHYDPDFQM